MGSCCDNNAANIASVETNLQSNITGVQTNLQANQDGLQVQIKDNEKTINDKTQRNAKLTYDNFFKARVDHTNESGNLMRGGNYQNDGKVQGYSLALFSDTEILYESHGGFPSLEAGSRQIYNNKTLYQTASTGKLFAATILAKLITLGLLDFDADVSDYLPVNMRNIGGKFRNPWFPDKVITTRMIYNMSAQIVGQFPYGPANEYAESDPAGQYIGGLYDAPSMLTWASELGMTPEQIQNLKDAGLGTVWAFEKGQTTATSGVPVELEGWEKIGLDEDYSKPDGYRYGLLREEANENSYLSLLLEYAPKAFFRNVEPGTDENYTDLHYDVIDQIIEHVLGVTYEEACQEHIFGPLGLTHTHTSWSQFYEQVPPVTDPDTGITKNYALKAEYEDAEMNRGAIYGQSKTWETVGLIDWMWGRSAQSTITCKDDIITLMRMIMGRGTPPGGVQVFSEEAMNIMNLTGGVSGYGFTESSTEQKRFPWPKYNTKTTTDGKLNLVGHGGSLTGGKSVLAGNIEGNIGLVLFSNGNNNWYGTTPAMYDFPSYLGGTVSETVNSLFE